LGTFPQKNANWLIAESIDRFIPLSGSAKAPRCAGTSRAWRCLYDKQIASRRGDADVRDDWVRLADRVWLASNRMPTNGRFRVLRSYVSGEGERQVSTAAVVHLLKLAGRSQSWS